MSSTAKRTLLSDPADNAMSVKRPASTKRYTKTMLTVRTKHGASPGEIVVDLDAETQPSSFRQKTGTLESLNQALACDGGRERFEAVAKNSLLGLLRDTATPTASETVLNRLPSQIARRLGALNEIWEVDVRVKYPNSDNTRIDWVSSNSPTKAEQNCLDRDWRTLEQPTNLSLQFNYNWTPVPASGWSRSGREEMVPERPAGIPTGDVSSLTGCSTVAPLGATSGLYPRANALRTHATIPAAPYDTSDPELFDMSLLDPEDPGAPEFVFDGP